jgi:hypothetical protein
MLNCSRFEAAHALSVWTCRSQKPISRKRGVKWGTGRYNYVDPADELYGDADDPLEIPAL